MRPDDRHRAETETDRPSAAGTWYRTETETDRPSAAGTWHRTEDLDAFLARAGAFLHSRPDLHTVTLTVTEGLRTRGPHAYGDERPVFGLLERDGAVRATYFQTPPYGLNLTALTTEGADSLAAHLNGLGRPLPGIGADRETAAAFAAAWQARTGATATLRQRQRLYRLGTLTVPEPAAEGRARVAGEADRTQLVRWYGEFVASIGEHAATDADSWADARIAYGGITFWETPDGTPVSMAGVTPQVAGQVRVAPVYTPAHLRGRGYAGAVTAEVSRAARDAGAEEVLLFTDLANPTSNALYQRIGYRPVADFAVYGFSG
ncbi:GNAT family N-acetyltransferase [Streptomyces sp. V4I2]|uniref:GNAT family N-acetyltransferase n=1 Tax=Streptomyces sp. V4I2 TaxID=3042280 RepID=UPI00277FFC4B|nr:GNAT family N-acetyltransferase [Streptomyces sp. V4I2]MDQ1046459.1 RimJ/RimL family protein N-acetyltransferase [Streptomyces sp. V4I2]